jgi:nitronate monooxygenase
MTSNSSSAALTRLLKSRLPIQLAPMAGPVDTELALAVTRAGGHAMFPAVMVPQGPLEAAIDHLLAETEAFGVNFIAPLLDRDCLEVAASRAPMVDLFYGDPDPAIVKAIHAGGALASWQVGSLDEALAAEDAGCDLLVLQGVEAGGRLRGELGLLELLESAAGRLSVPVMAAGGIATADDVAAAIDAGAAGVRVGTRFIAAGESHAHPAWQRALIRAGAADTVVTRAFAVGVPDLPHRVLSSSLAAAKVLTEPNAGSIERADGRRMNLPTFAPDAPTRTAEGHVEAMPFYAGLSAAAVNRIQPAAEIVAELATGVPLAHGKARALR